MRMARITETRFGSFDGKLSTPVYAQGWWFFVAPTVTLDGPLRVSELLADHVVGKAPETLRPLLEVQQDACWARARLPTAFGHHQVSGSPTKSLIDLALVAVQVKEDRSEETSYPFLCRDEGGRTTLCFSGAGPDASTRQSIVGAFVARLLSGGEHLADFESTLVGEDGAIIAQYSCRDGHLSWSRE
jgi:hypothetical protein